MTQTPPPPPAVNLYEVAKRQKAVLFWLLLLILAHVAVIYGKSSFPVPALLFLILAFYAVAVTTMVFVFRLAIKVYGIGWGIFGAILVLVPIISLFALLVINGKATKILRAHEIHVGFLGADLAQIRDSGDA